MHTVPFYPHREVGYYSHGFKFAVHIVSVFPDHRNYMSIKLTHDNYRTLQTAPLQHQEPY